MFQFNSISPIGIFKFLPLDLLDFKYTQISIEELSFGLIDIDSLSSLPPYAKLLRLGSTVLKVYQ